eukprot:1117954-Prymnesium_polylepis.1
MQFSGVLHALLLLAFPQLKAVASTSQPKTLNELLRGMVPTEQSLNRSRGLIAGEMFKWADAGDVTLHHGSSATKKPGVTIQGRKFYAANGTELPFIVSVN